MAHYAYLDENNIVTEVITGKDENDLETLPENFDDWEHFYSDFRGQACKRTSYNTLGNEHLNGGSAFRGNYAGLGYTYDTENDVFIPPKPFNSWILDENTWLYKPPVDYPNDNENTYTWNEETQSWDLQG